jgi:hypothetical protein
VTRGTTPPTFFYGHYRKLLRGHWPQMQQILRRLVVGKLTFTPKLNGDYEFAGRGTVRPLLAGEVRKLASPTGGRDTYEPGPREAYELPLCGTVHKAA